MSSVDDPVGVERTWTNFKGDIEEERSLKDREDRHSFFMNETKVPVRGGYKLQCRMYGGHWKRSQLKERDRRSQRGRVKEKG